MARRMLMYKQPVRQGEHHRKFPLSQTHSTEDLGKTKSDPLGYPQRPSTLKSRARQVSRSVRTRLRSLFSGAKAEEEEPTIPCQHVEAQRTHVTYNQTSSVSKHELDEEAGEHIRSAPAKVPILHVSDGLVHSSKASMQSLESGQDRNVSGGSSSLTSWVHSGPSTLTSQEQQQWREWEKQRLSVIGENGAHVPSPSIRRQGLGSGVFQPPGGADEVQFAPRQVVDSQRIYSALVKRMQATNDTGEKLEEQTESHGRGDSPTGRDASQYHSSDTPATIKRVPSERDHLAGSHDSNTPTANNRNIFAHGDERSKWRSTDVGSPASHLFRTGSPYRRALRKSIEEEQNAWAQQSAVADQESDTSHTNHLAGDDLDLATDLDYSESVYSSDESERGHTEAADANKPNSYADAPAMSRQNGPRQASTASSVDWKTWLSANVGKSGSKPSKRALAQPPGISITAPKPFSSLRGHVREAAQIHDDDNDCDHSDTGIYNNEDDVFGPSAIGNQSPWADSTPLSQLQPNIIANSSSLRHHASPNKRRLAPLSVGGINLAATTTINNNNNSLLVENESPTRPPPQVPPPPIPPRSKLRPEPLRVWRSNGGGGGGDGIITSPAAASVSGSMSVMSSPGLTEAVRRQFGGGGFAGLGGSGSVSGSGSRVGFGFGLGSCGENSSYGDSAKGQKGDSWVDNHHHRGIAEVLLEEGAGHEKKVWGDEGSAFV
ncbi:hypothetical protein C7999DRAFT_38124 [Corynascus novoguineensis]|uniref:Uncharacterized protein n=1 Tax=Corynascus novoguineensis TaxID=1126955 RepID=A0AAN7D011_9PEZI|nr:hypothetical protein C7999DRAFT_38124 [Corynascus novoguineensis]